MYCGKCGQEIYEDNSFCSRCGAPAPVNISSVPQQQATQFASNNTKPNTTNSLAESLAQENREAAVRFIVAGIAIFVVCSIIQGFGESSMFSLTFYRTGNAFLDILISISMIPGWIITVGLVGRGVLLLLASQPSSSLENNNSFTTSNNGNPAEPKVEEKDLKYCSSCKAYYDKSVSTCKWCGKIL